MSRCAAVAVRRAAQGLFVFLIFLSAFGSGSGHAQEAVSDRDAYYRAVAYCRGDVPRPMALSPDGQILCFDGPVPSDLDTSPAKDLRENGFFVARSPGGDGGPAARLSDIVRDHHATVIIYDFCNSACAMFFQIASYQTYVLKGTLVTWHYPQSGDPDHPFCNFLIAPRDGEPKRLQLGPCQSGGERGVYRYWTSLDRFLEERLFDPSAVPPQSLYVRKIVASRYAERGFYSDILWTLHPRYYPQLFKTKVVYEAYPQSQEEVDELQARLRLPVRVIHDP